MDGLNLLEEARAAGLTVQVQGTKLVIRGPSRAEAIARQLIAQKAAVLAALALACPEDRPGSSFSSFRGSGDRADLPAVVAEGRLYALPWPDHLPRLGSRRVGPFDLCADCERWSWVRYGKTVLCIGCAKRRIAPTCSPRSSEGSPP